MEGNSSLPAAAYSDADKPAPLVMFFSTSVPTTAKVKADIARIRRILDGKQVAYVEVRASAD